MQLSLTSNFLTTARLPVCSAELKIFSFSKTLSDHSNFVSLPAAVLPVYLNSTQYQLQMKE